MATQNSTPRLRSLDLLRQAMTTGIRGHNLEAVQAAIGVLEDDGKGGLTDLHYKQLRTGKTLRDPNRPGLWMRRNKSSAIWLLNYTSPITSEEKAYKIGSYPAMPLVMAREKWQELRAAMEEGKDPHLSKAQQRAAQAEASRIDNTTIAQLCDRFIDEYAKHKKRSWKEDRRMFDFDLVPSLGDSLVFDVSRDDIEDVLDAIIERGSPRSAEKLLTATRKLFNHAIQKRWVKGLAVNPCQHIKLENRQTVSVCLNESEICSFLTKLPDSSIGGDYQQILTLQFLTVSRVSEVAGMAWSEVDLKNKIWTLPAARSKNKQSHRIMLSRQAVTLLKGREKTVTGDFVFPAARSSKPIPGTLVARYMRDKRDYLGIPDGASPHSLRHTAITQLAKMQCGKELRDRISNHKDSSIDAVYQHYEHDTEASKWWQKWANEMDKLKRAKQVEKA